MRQLPRQHPNEPYVLPIDGVISQSVFMKLLFLGLIYFHCAETQPFLLATPTSCSTTNHSIFDPFTYKCQQCSSNALPDNSGVICKCDHNSISTTEGCKSCPSDSIVSPDGKICLDCRNGVCNCNSTSVLLYRHNNGSIMDTPICQQCAIGTQPDQLISICRVCEDQQCLCNRNASRCPNPNMKYNGFILQLRSQMAETRIPWAYVACEQAHLAACQELLNLCVLQNYANAQDNACHHYNELANNKLRTRIVPYTPVVFNSVKSNGGPQQKFRFDNTDNGHLSVMVGTYYLNGTLKSFAPIIERNAVICPISQKTLRAAFTFGVAFSLECEVELGDLEDFDGLFYELFLLYTKEHDNGTHTRLMNPFFVVTDLLNPGISFSDTQIENWQLSKRFFLVDTSSLRQDNKSTVIRYAKSFEFLIYFDSSRDGKIGVPLVKIEYETSTAIGIEHSSLTTSISIRYSNDPFRHDKDLEITMAVLCSLSILWAAVRAYSWGRRAGKQLADASTILQLVLHEASILGDVFLLVITVMACWLTFAYKSQTFVFYHLLLHSQQTTMLIYVSVATFLKFVGFLHTSIRLMMTETFFIDWEKPKIVQENNTQRPVTVDSSKDRTRLPVVIWRTYLVANEWNELQNYRKTSVGLQCFAVLFFLEYLEWINFATVQPGFSAQSPLPGLKATMETRWAVAMFVYLIIAFIQWAISVLVVERIIVDPFHNFIDLCSISNISVLALTHPQHGFYIHGRSVHGRADTDMREMNEFLQRERDNLCGFRGLEANTELQTFIVNLPAVFRQQYDAIKKGAILSPNVLRMSGTDTATAKINVVSKTHEQANVFLQEMIDHSINNVDYSIRDRTFVESVLDMELDDNSVVGSFIRDHSEVAYSSCFMYGNEWSALSFEALLFCLSFILFDSLTFSSVLTYIISHIIRQIVSMMFTNHLVASSCVDQRFLI